MHMIGLMEVLLENLKTFLQEFWNTYSPAFKQSEEISPVKQFLIDVEFDGRPQLNTNGNGVEYSPEQRSQVTQIMGESKIFAREVQLIMNSPEGRRFRAAFKEATKNGVKLDRKEFLNVHRRLRRALRKSQNLAEYRIEERGIVEKKQYYNNRIELATREGDIEEITRLQKIANRL